MAQRQASRLLTLTDRLNAGWERFWFAPYSVIVLDRFRIAVGLILLLTQLGAFTPTGHPFDPFGLPVHHFSHPSEYALGSGMYHLPYVSWLPTPSFGLYRGLERLLLVWTIAFTVGLWTRLAAAVVAGLSAYFFFLSQVDYHNNTYLMALCLILLATSPCGTQWSLDRWLTRSQDTPPVLTRHPARRLLQVLASSVYLLSAISKTTPTWLSGAPLMDLLSHPMLRTTPAAAAALSLPSWLAGTGVVLCEYALGIGLWVPMIRWWVMGVGIAFHLAIQTTMFVSSFSAQMLALYLVFLPPPRPAYATAVRRQPNV